MTVLQTNLPNSSWHPHFQKRPIYLPMLSSSTWLRITVSQPTLERKTKSLHSRATSTPMHLVPISYSYWQVTSAVKAYLKVGRRPCSDSCRVKVPYELSLLLLVFSPWVVTTPRAKNVKLKSTDGMATGYRSGFSSAVVKPNLIAVYYNTTVRKWSETTTSTHLQVDIVEALQVLTSQVRLSVLLALCQRHVERLSSNDAVVHVRDGLRRFVWTAEADKAETFRSTILHHHLQHSGTPFSTIACCVTKISVVYSKSMRPGFLMVVADV